MKLAKVFCCVFLLAVLAVKRQKVVMRAHKNYQ